MGKAAAAAAKHDTTDAAPAVAAGSDPQRRQANRSRRLAAFIEDGTRNSLGDAKHI
jgi:hypothetical protein